jgi:phosphoribosylaminoimidazole-succinocarboxamide synthase
MLDIEGVERVGAGKVRDLYAVDGALLLVASDRISAYDVVLPTPIPDKGKVLTRLTDFWLDALGDVVGHHRISTDVDEYPPVLRPHADALRGRSMLCRRAQPLPVECVARGYLSGSGWRDYRRSGTVGGVPLPAGLVESQRLPEPVFTPATKATEGHDENIDEAAVAALLGQGLADRLKRLTLTLYERAAAHCAERGIILADTKFEFGTVDGELILIDEVCTPDSSRFWPADGYRPGGPQPSYDKQYVRDWLDASGWDHAPPAPELPPDVVAKTRERYVTAYERLSDRRFEET